MYVVHVERSEGQVVRVWSPRLSPGLVPLSRVVITTERVGVRTTLLSAAAGTSMTWLIPEEWMGSLMRWSESTLKGVNIKSSPRELQTFFGLSSTVLEVAINHHLFQKTLK